MTPEQRERVNARHRERYQNDPVFREHRKAGNRERARVRRRTSTSALRSEHRSKGVDTDHPAYAAIAVRAVCDLCGTTRTVKRALCVDHDHATGQPRGKLCLLCNRAVAQFGDNAIGLARALAYVSGYDLDRFRVLGALSL